MAYRGAPEGVFLPFKASRIISDKSRGLGQSPMKAMLILPLVTADNVHNKCLPAPGNPKIDEAYDYYNGPYTHQSAFSVGNLFHTLQGTVFPICTT